MNERHTPTSRRALGLFGRLGRWSAHHRRAVFVAWAVLILALGAFAPRAEHALSGGGWQADGSESVAARSLIDRHFGGEGSYALAVVVSSRAHAAGDPVFRHAVAAAARVLRDEPAVAAVTLPQPGRSVSRDGHVAVVRGGAGAGTAEMVRAASRVERRLAVAGSPGVQLALTGSPALWSQFNDENKTAMLRSEVMSWPLTMVVLLIAFGSLAAAGIPLLLAISGLVATAGALWLGTRVTGITIWAMNFALMFALAVGIDYALFVVVRFRSALRSGLQPIDAVGETMDTAGKAVVVSGLAVLASLSAVILVPSQPFRTSVFGILLAVGLVLAMSLTLLPAVLATLGSRIDRFALPWAGAVQHRSERFARWGRLVARRPVLVGALAAGVLVALALPVLHLHTAMPNAGVLTRHASARVASERLQQGFGPGAPAELQVVAPRAAAGRVQHALERGPGVAAVLPPQQAGRFALLRVQPSSDDPGALIERMRQQLPAGALTGGAAAEAHDLERVLRGRTPLVFALVSAIGFLLLLTIVRAPLAAAFAVLLNLLATAATFGVATLIFQDGGGEGLLGFHSQGFVDAWAPVFFFCLSFALAMDYTVFLLISVREELERTGDARAALVEGLARSGRVINAAGAVMVVVFFTFAMSGPLPPKEMGVILGVAVLLDTVLVRLALLPAVLRLLGDRAWWVPTFVERWLPHLRLRDAQPEPAGSVAVEHGGAPC
ncbi:MMPL family transporter [Capillimicrobium parvum]|uniref:Membrane protein YdfJ n=1 Tax=Capillimicrobium parvum TaxID=2884022 RepID=A0A9E7BZV1_9ACTN|nr:MMPL family transporter [Capillimicrobium parvum]UGS34723.1 Membrane protein YdfJ [Capillimicrobium parvum]